MKIFPLSTSVVALWTLLTIPAAQAATLRGDDWSLRYNAVLGYAAAVRTETQDDVLINGPVDPTTGLPVTANVDDGNRNFSRGALINNRASLLAEMEFSAGAFGAVLRGDAFIDQAYRRRNDNDSPQTVNKEGAPDRFSDAARARSGERVRLLDAYAYGDWALDERTYLSLRAGRQVVAWGESLFFSGMASAQGPVDATRANVPGVALKNILLPVSQLAAQLDLGMALSLYAYYRLEYKPNELEPVGAYFSPFDGVGPGARFLYGFANPLAGMPGAPPVTTIPRGPDLQPDDQGQYGLGVTYAFANGLELGAYWLRYHNTNPQVEIEFGFAELAPGVTTAPELAPVRYRLRYFDDIDMAAVSASTRLGPANVAAEINLRDGIDLLANTAVGPTAVRGRAVQALVSTLFVLPPNALSQQIDVTGEAGWLHVDDLDTPGGPAALANDRTAWAVSLLATLQYPNLFPQWDMAVPLSFAMMGDGRPAIDGAFGALYGAHDRRASVGARFTRLQRFEIGLAYNAFLGSPDLQNRPFTDRDYASLDLKYHF